MTGAADLFPRAGRRDGLRRRNWRDEIIPPAEMLTEDIRAELRHDLDVYERVRHPLSKAGMAHRIEALVEEMDARVAAGRA